MLNRCQGTLQYFLSIPHMTSTQNFSMQGDLGGQRTLQKKWTSFLKARLDCPVPNINLPLLVQDMFHLCQGDWTTCIFYGVFTLQL